jgi:hypothetical protein
MSSTLPQRGSSGRSPLAVTAAITTAVSIAMTAADRRTKRSTAAAADVSALAILGASLTARLLTANSSADSGRCCSAAYYCCRCHWRQQA